MLEAGALCGVPVSPREIENLMQMTGKAKIERVQKSEAGDGDPPAGVQAASCSGRRAHSRKKR